MKIFLIILAVLAVLIIAICSLSATITLVYDKGWKTELQVLFIKKDIVLSKILSFLLFPEKKAQEVAGKSKEKKNDTEKTVQDNAEAVPADNTETKSKKSAAPVEEKQPSETIKPPAKSNPIKKLWDDQGIVGIMGLVTNVFDTANSAVLTLIRGLHIYSLYVMIIVGGWDAGSIGIAYGELCRYYYPLKGILLNQLKIDNYDDYIQPDFLAERNEYEFQLVASISVGLLLKVGIKAAVIFLKNLIADKKLSKNINK